MTLVTHFLWFFCFLGCSILHVKIATMHVHGHVCVCVCVFVHACWRTCAHKCLCKCMYAWVYVCVCVCVCVCVYVCVCVCVHINECLNGSFTASKRERETTGDFSCVLIHTFPGHYENQMGVIKHSPPSEPRTIHSPSLRSESSLTSFFWDLVVRYSL